MKKAGFTLLELMAVVVIVGILASVGIPQYTRAIERMRSADALSILGAIRTSEHRFKIQDPSGVYTTTLTNLDIGVPTSALWSFLVSGTAAGSNAVATRSVGAFAGRTVSLDLDNGATCSDDAVYGLPAGPC